MITNRYKLRMTGHQYEALRKHLLTDDGLEAVSVALCGVAERQDTGRVERIVAVHCIEHIPYSHCTERTSSRVTWSTKLLSELIAENSTQQFVVLKIHSHTDGSQSFSELDDESDRCLYESLAGWFQRDFVLVSAVMLPEGRIVARAWDGGATPVYFESVVVAGDDIYIWNSMNEADTVDEDMDEIQQRTHQTFGQGTTALLRKLSVGVVGVSGTGSPLVEMLFRLGVGTLVLVDADTIEKKNLGRIYNSSRRDMGSYKVDVIARAIKQSGLNTKVLPIHTDLYHTSAIATLAQCDMVFGCMDSIDGRDLLNKLAVYYSLPYWDVGVGIEADGNGGVDFVGVSVHYLTPDGPTLLERKAYTSELLRASYLKRTDPEEYEDLLDEGYIHGTREERPAVISVNTLAASLAVNDFLARIHGFRWFSNADYSAGRFNLSDAYFRYEPAPNVKSSLGAYVGRGDTVPPLGEMYVVQ